MCIFEYVYFARPDSIIEGQMVYGVRKRCGELLAGEAPIIGHDPTRDGELIVSPVPESAIPAALGFAAASGLRYTEVFCKNRYVGRTFIQPSARLRRLGVAKKFGPLIENFRGKSIVLVDDSIVRGTTIGQLVRLLKDAGALQVHIRVASPPLHHPCYMGINIPTAEELIANHLSPEKLASTLGAASLVHLSVEGLKTSVQSGIREAQRQWPRSTANDQVREATSHAVGHCTACLTGEYPVELEF
jgi:amidophosphoribosyltransferase